MNLLLLTNYIRGTSNDEIVKLRQLPEDFIVEELSNIPFSENSSYRVYILEKRGLDTLWVINYLAQQYKIPKELIGYAGLKDKHALTRQYLTIPENYEILCNEENLKLSQVGFTNRPIHLGDLSGNQFQITIRGLLKGELNLIQSRVELIQVPNYFDSQRFGSLGSIQKEEKPQFIMQYVLNSDYMMAVRLFLTKRTVGDNKIIREDKRNLAANWDNFASIQVRNSIFKKLITTYNRSKDWYQTYESIPHDLKMLFKSAYQSYLWNECIKELLKQNVDSRYLYRISYAAGGLIFFKQLNANLPDSFHTISQDAPFTPIEHKIVQIILRRENLTLDNFHDFDSHNRSIILIPRDFQILSTKEDDLNSKGGRIRYQITLKFVLPPGSYATIITKRLLNK